MPLSYVVNKKDVKINLTKDTETSILKSCSVNDTIVKISIKITEAFDGDKKFTVGIPSNHSFFIAEDDINLNETNIYEFTYYYKVSSTTTLSLYGNGSSSQGNIELTVVII
jgi:hypothetical protein